MAKLGAQTLTFKSVTHKSVTDKSMTDKSVTDRQKLNVFGHPGGG